MNFQQALKGVKKVSGEGERKRAIYGGLNIHKVLKVGSEQISFDHH